MTESPFLIIAVDGGAASGKSSTSREVAKRLHYLYVDSGSHYRKITAALLEENIFPKNKEEIQAALSKMRLQSDVQDGVSHLVIENSEFDNDSLRSPEVNANVSLFARNRDVREFLFSFQQSQADIAREGGFQGLIMEGRDIGTVIFPEADFKFFLTASEDVRTLRREGEGQFDMVRERDALDARRTTAPFIPADDSIEINTNELGLEEVVDVVCAIIRKAAKPEIPTGSGGDAPAV